MAITASDWTVDRSTKVIQYTGNDHSGSPTYANVIDFHRWLQALADDAVASGDDELDITNTDPSKRSTDNIITLINGYTLGTTTLDSWEFLFDGSIIQDGGDTIYDGIVNFGNASVQIHILQDGARLTDAWWNQAGAGLNPDAAAGISHRFLVPVRQNGVDIDQRKLIGICRTYDDTDQNTYSEFKINGTSRGNNVLALADGSDLNNSTIATTVGAWTNITNTEGLNLIDVNALGGDEEYYSKWVDDDTPDRGINDFYERYKYESRIGTSETIHGMSGDVFRGITHSFAYDTEGGAITPTHNQTFVWGTHIDVTGHTGDFTVGEAVHEDTATPVWKGRVLAFDNANDILIVDVESGTVTAADTITGQSSSATATVGAGPITPVGSVSGALVTLAVDDDGAAGNFYVQQIRGAAPVDNSVLYLSTDCTDSVLVAGSLTERSISTPFCGVSTGSALIGAYGFGMATADLSNTDSMTALDGNQYSRPNLVTNTVGGLTSTGDVDRVLVGPWDGTTYDVNGDPSVDKGQLLLSTALALDNITEVVVKTGTETAIPGDTPTSGYLRVTDDLGFERRLHYSSWTGTTFTIDTTDGNEDFLGDEAAVNNQVWIAYLDVDASAASHNYEATYVSDRDLVALVRNGGSAPIKQFIAEWSFTDASATLNAIRTTDL